jgi:hypothetical protein
MRRVICDEIEDSKFCIIFHELDMKQKRKLSYGLLTKMISSGNIFPCCVCERYHDMDSKTIYVLCSISL